MKKAALVLALLLLTGCGQETSALPGDGVVVDCASIATVTTTNDSVSLECLDGNSSVDIGTIKGQRL